jgi:CDGSH-type Zn-finger protein
MGDGERMAPRDGKAATVEQQAAKLAARTTALIARLSGGNGGIGDVVAVNVSQIVGRLRASVLRPLQEVSAGGGAGSPVGITAIGPDPEETPDATISDLALAVTTLAQREDAPVVIGEAVAALQALACGGAFIGGGFDAARCEGLRALQAARGQEITVSPNGPYLVTNVDLVDWLGAPIQAPPTVALCRCGASAMKPWCDGSHVTSGFTDAKDAKRVPDQLDTYPAKQATVTDNRGTCAHSGFCTDQLASAFRADKEPFVDAGGARIDEILRAVRACPSGALGVQLHADTSPGQADQSRATVIEVSRDGPYRVRGGVALQNASGDDVARTAGSSAEHYSLCRCGHSLNKPFCSGMHWYVDFKDPVVPGEASAAPAADDTVAIPAADVTLTFDEHITPLFRARDQAAMAFAFDLSAYTDVAANAPFILQKVKTGSMPCDTAWPEERVALFQRWVDTGMLESAVSTPAPAPSAAPPPSVDGMPEEQSNGADLSLVGVVMSAASDDARTAVADSPVAIIKGQLGSVVALRSSTSAEEPAIVLEHREPLIYMLCAAAELEHALMCEYLFAAFSLKRSVDEGLTAEQLAVVERWRATVLLVAKQEMLHLAINCNLVSSLGASPHLSRPNLPQPAKHYPAGVRLALLPFSRQALQHFLFLERPEGLDIDDAEGLEAVDCAVPAMGGDEIAPHLQEFQTVGHLYRSIEAGFRNLSDKLGEDRLFLGPADAQTHGELFGWPQLGPVTTCDAAMRSIEAIVEQGEGSRGDWRNAHFGRFLDVLKEYDALMEENPGLEVARPVLPVLVRPPESGERADLITDPTTARVADLCNVGYEVLLQLLYRLMCRVDEGDEEIKTLADVGVGLMFGVIEPLADILTTLPVGPEHPGRTAGATFELFYQPDYLLPHRRAAWLLMAEHLGDAAVIADSLLAGDERMSKVAGSLRGFASTLTSQAG